MAVLAYLEHNAVCSGQPHNAITFFSLYKMSYYLHAHQTFEDQYPSPTKYLPLTYLLERHLEILKCKFMCV